MSPAQRAELDVRLSPPEKKDEMIARQNELAMRTLAAQGGPVLRPLVPPKPKAG